MQVKYERSNRNIGSSRKVKRPTPEKEAGRVVVLALLSLALPPLGMLFCWRSDQVNLPGKAALSVVAVFSLTVMLCFSMGGSAREEILPAPVTPEVAGYAQPKPVEAPAMATASPADPSGGTGGVDNGYGLPVDPADMPAQATVVPEITVYTVRSNATLYHAQDSCEGQVNRRALTLAEAIAEGLTPCPNCNPPQ